MINRLKPVSLLLLLLPSLTFARVYPVVWTAPAKVEYLRVSATGDGVTSTLDTADLIFVKLQNQVIENPANCTISDKYAFMPASSNGKESLMYSTLLSAAMAGNDVQLAISTEFCDNLHPTIYDVKLTFGP